jgi:hypothetical protein
MCRKFVGIWLSNNKATIMIGISVMSGVKTAGMVERQPMAREREMRKILKELGRIVDGKARATPWRKKRAKSVP